MSTNTIDSETKNDSTKHSVPSAASKTGHRAASGYGWTRRRFRCERRAG
jgi:hypothetical protein